MFAGTGSSLTQKIEDNAAIQLSEMESAIPNGYHSRPVNSSRFSSNQAQLHSAQKAETIYNQAGKNSFTFYMDDTIGEGYRSGGGYTYTVFESYSSI